MQGTEREREGSRANSPWGAQLETRIAVGVNYFAIDQLSMCRPFAELSYWLTVMSKAYIYFFFIRSLGCHRPCAMYKHKSYVELGGCSRFKNVLPVLLERTLQNEVSVHY